MTMKWFKDITNKRTEMHKESAMRRAEEIFNVAVYDNDLWLTANGCYVAPFSILTSNGCDVAECVGLVSTIRELYVNRTTK